MKAERAGCIIICFSLMFFLGGCASMNHFFQPPPPSSEAAALLSFAESHNSRLTVFKGLGKAEVVRPDEKQAFRLAWIGERPNQLRIGVLNLYGTPTVTIAADGDYFYALSHSTARYYKSKDSSPGLGNVIHISIQIQDVIELMCGRVPLGDFHTADVTYPEEGRAVLSLKSRWGKTIHRIVFQDAEKRIAGYERFDSTGKSVYQVTFNDYRDQQGFEIPFTIEIMNDDTKFSLQMDRFWPNTKLPAAAFVLKKPNA